MGLPLMRKNSIVLIEAQKQIIAGISRIDREYIDESKSDWNARRIVTKKGFVNTEYFAKKRTAQAAMNVFCRSDWSEVEMWVYYENMDWIGRYAKIRASRIKFLDFWGIDPTKTSDTEYMLKSFWGKDYHRNDIIRFADKFKI